MEETMPVRVIETKGASALVEWEANGPHRAYVPKAAVGDGQADAYVLALGIPYGIDWETWIALPGDLPAVVGTALRRAGIWTYADLQQHDRALIRIGTDMIGKAVWDAAKRAPK